MVCASLTLLLSRGDQRIAPSFKEGFLTPFLIVNSINIILKVKINQNFGLAS